MPDDGIWPRVRFIGLDGILVSFAEALSEPANRAALAFRAAVDSAHWDGVVETSTSLVSTYLRFDPVSVEREALQERVQTLMSARDWLNSDHLAQRKRWHIPAAFGGQAGPQLAEAAAMAGLSEEAAIASLTRTSVRVLTVGFAPGMTYLGEMSPEWNIPRQTQLTARVPAGGLCVAIRQLVLFPVSTPTGWRQVGQTALRLFDPSQTPPTLLAPGNEVLFQPVSPEDLSDFRRDPMGGAVAEVLS